MAVHIHLDDNAPVLRRMHIDHVLTASLRLYRVEMHLSIKGWRTKSTS